MIIINNYILKKKNLKIHTFEQSKMHDDNYMYEKSKGQYSTKFDWLHVFTLLHL